MKTPITSIEIIFTGGKGLIETILPAQQHRLQIRPSSESDVYVTYIDSKGNIVHFNLDVYIEQSYKGKIEVSLKENGKFDKRYKIMGSWLDYFFTREAYYPDCQQ